MVSPLVKRRLASLLVLAAATAGCSPAWYRADADREVRELIRDRADATLGYTPQVDAAATADPEPGRPAYDRLPLTALPEGPPDQLEPATVSPEVAAFGPVLFDLPQPEDQDVAAIATPTARRVILERLRFGPPAGFGDAMRLELFGALRYAIANSREYRSQMEALYLAALDVTLERHLFTPRPFASVGARYNGGQLESNYNAALTAVGSAGVRQRLPYGGEIVASGLVEFVQALDGNVQDGESAEAALTGTIPLLRGAGMVNLEPLISSERELVYSTREFEAYRRNFVVSISAAYFRLVVQQQQIRNRYINYRNARDLTERSAALYAAGRFNVLELQRSLQSLLRAEDAINDAVEGYANAVDNFKLLLGMPMEQELDVVPVEVVLHAPDLGEQGAIEAAMQYRLDLQTARDRFEDSRRRVQNARNGLLPDLDIGLEARGGSLAGESASQLDSRTLDYGARIDLDLPLDRVAERNSYRRALISLQRQSRTVEEVADQVRRDIRRSRRGIRSSELTLEIQLRNIEVARQRLEYANEALATGRATDSRNVVEAQDSLLSAQDTYDSARSQLQIQLLEFLRDTALLRIDPEAGTLGLAMRRPDPAEGEQPTVPSVP